MKIFTEKKLSILKQNIFKIGYDACREMLKEAFGLDE